MAAPRQAGAVNTRADKVAGEYLRAAQKLDRDAVGVATGTVGPIESAVRTHGGVIGLAMGACGEASQTVEDLLEWCASVAAAAQWQRLGYTSKERCRAAFLCGYRDRVATALYRAKAEHLLGNTRWVEGAAVNRYTLPDDCTDYHAAYTLRRQTQYPRDFRPVARPARGARERAH